MMIIIFSHDDHHNFISWSSYDDMIILSSYIFADVGLGCVGPARHCHPPVIGLKKSHSSLLFALHCRPTMHIYWVVVDKLSAAMHGWWETNTDQCKILRKTQNKEIWNADDTTLFNKVLPDDQTIQHWWQNLMDCIYSYLSRQCFGQQLMDKSKYDSHKSNSSWSTYNKNTNSI